MLYEQAPQTMRLRTLVLERRPHMPREVPLETRAPCRIDVRSCHHQQSGPPRYWRVLCQHR
ncbi:hypothetical protein ODJ79_46035 [Actinoplanes sp. KI2]|uniref:hypothetical protein n=1 Tax=Actinoplanes sp. KI2 TaxID=2983315 RepID=UPI0021D5D898|nr:hypothetical protein [Actinoplanes sp. KI2]MCU7731117.1 hypothetical protein [Actinoplanes sp. KI2]